MGNEALVLAIVSFQAMPTLNEAHWGPTPNYKTLELKIFKFPNGTPILEYYITYIIVAQ